MGDMASQLDCVSGASADGQPKAGRNRWEIESRSGPAPLLNDDDEEEAPKSLQYRDIVMDLSTLRARRGERLVHLNPTEFRLLRLLLEQPERAFTRQELKASVWGYGAKLDPRSISVYLGRLRRALTAAGEANVIRTITGYGYSLDATCPDMR
jgi:DNA-binding response OmpR family regulator